MYLEFVFISIAGDRLCWFITSQSAIFQSCQDVSRVEPVQEKNKSFVVVA